MHRTIQIMVVLQDLRIKERSRKIIIQHHVNGLLIQKSRILVSRMTEWINLMRMMLSVMEEMEEKRSSEKIITMNLKMIRARVILLQKTSIIVYKTSQKRIHRIHRLLQ